MLGILLRTSITLIGVLAGTTIVEYIRNNELMSIFYPGLANNYLFVNSIYFGIVLSCTGLFFLASSVIFQGVKVLDTQTESYIKKSPGYKKLGVIFGVLTGLLFAFLLTPVLEAFSPRDENLKGIFILFSYALICAVIAKLSSQTFFSLLFNYTNKGISDNNSIQEDISPKYEIILDTNVMIDRRIVKIIELGFLKGPFIIPNFVLEELQYIADSEDDIRRRKGRRGLDSLNDLKLLLNKDLTIKNCNYPADTSVDNKLLMLSVETGAKLLTVDFNLSKVATIRGIKTLNINELAAAMKPDFLPGEELEIKLIKGGKAKGQALGYLDDGTMVVVQDAEDLIGKDVSVEVTSSIQTGAGKMIFGKRIM